MQEASLLSRGIKDTSTWLFFSTFKDQDISEVFGWSGESRNSQLPGICKLLTTLQRKTATLDLPCVSEDWSCAATNLYFLFDIHNNAEICLQGFGKKKGLCCAKKQQHTVCAPRREEHARLSVHFCTERWWIILSMIDEMLRKQT